MTTLTVQVTVDLPGPTLRSFRMDHYGQWYILQRDVVEWIIATADAFDSAHANADLGKAFRAAAESLSAARPTE